MRGKELFGRVFFRGFGITPAYAGKSSRSSASEVRCRDHPRVCGEKLSGSERFRQKKGSPPRMRGKESDEIVLLALVGITPAYAGKSTHHYSEVIVKKDHPRVCGEKWQGLQRVGNLSGSPPRMRGKVFFPLNCNVRHGITPAYAGKSIGDVVGQLFGGDHPRVCGEKISGCIISQTPAGSPPRMRGKGVNPPENHCSHGITPAYAGKSMEQTTHKRKNGDHPRVCGEKIPWEGIYTMKEGSPPRMRGKDLTTERRAGGCRITPAYAGKSVVHFDECRRGRDHPRVCGEKFRPTITNGSR